MRRAGTAGFSLVVVLSLLWAPSAEAQEWLQNREMSEGPGVRLGDSMVFHPGAGLEAGYDSNVFHSDDNGPGTGVLRLSVDLDLATRPPQRREGRDGEVQRGNIEFRFGVGAAYYEYLTGDDRISQHRNVALDAGLRLHIVPNRPFSVIIEDNYTRDIRPQNEVGPRNYDRDDNDARLTFQWSPEGDVFNLRFGYAFQLRYYEEAGIGGNLQAQGNYTAHEAFASVSWRFLPKTSLTFNGSFRPILQMGEATSTGRPVYDSYHARGTVGLVGLLARKFSLLIEAGYGGGFYLNGGPDYDTFVGSLGLRFHISPTVRLSVQYNRDVYNSVFSHFYTRDRVSASYNHLIAGRVLISLDVGFSYVDYVPVTYADTGIQLDRQDPIVDAKLFVEYRIRDFLAINATLQYIGNFSTTDLPLVGFVDDPAGFQRFEALAGVRVMY